MYSRVCESRAFDAEGYASIGRVSQKKTEEEAPTAPAHLSDGLGLSRHAGDVHERKSRFHHLLSKCADLFVSQPPPNVPIHLESDSRARLLARPWRTSVLPHVYRRGGRTTGNPGVFILARVTCTTTLPATTTLAIRSGNSLFQFEVSYPARRTAATATATPTSTTIAAVPPTPVCRISTASGTPPPTPFPDGLPGAPFRDRVPPTSSPSGGFHNGRVSSNESNIAFAPSGSTGRRTLSVRWSRGAWARGRGTVCVLPDEAAGTSVVFRPRGMMSRPGAN